MNGLFTLLIFGIVIYMLFPRKGGMGCCGGHHDSHSDGSSKRDPEPPVNPVDGWKNNIIDLKKEDYQVITTVGHSGAGKKTR